jgi:exosome complex component RRP45
MGYVTAQLVQPYKERPNEGKLAIFAEFSPMADPAYEPGRSGEAAIELGRVIDRGQRFPDFPVNLRGRRVKS